MPWNNRANNRKLASVRYHRIFSTANLITATEIDTRESMKNINHNNTKTIKRNASSQLSPVKVLFKLLG